MIHRAGLAPRLFEFPFAGSLISTFLPVAGPYCYELSVVSKCLVGNVESQSSCLAKGGSWVPPANDWESAYR